MATTMTMAAAMTTLPAAAVEAASTTAITAIAIQSDHLPKTITVPSLAPAPAGLSSEALLP
jgi:hypothetical protein